MISAFSCNTFSSLLSSAQSWCSLSSSIYCHKPHLSTYMYLVVVACLFVCLLLLFTYILVVLVICLLLFCVAVGLSVGAGDFVFYSFWRVGGGGTWHLERGSGALKQATYRLDTGTSKPLLYEHGQQPQQRPGNLCQKSRLSNFCFLVYSAFSSLFPPAPHPPTPQSSYYTCQIRLLLWAFNEYYCVSSSCDFCGLLGVTCQMWLCRV